MIRVPPHKLSYVWRASSLPGSGKKWSQDDVLGGPLLASLYHPLEDTGGDGHGDDQTDQFGDGGF